MLLVIVSLQGSFPFGFQFFGTKKKSLAQFLVSKNGNAVGVFDTAQQGGESRAPKAFAGSEDINVQVIRSYS
jgi:hypothetical protein